MRIIAICFLLCSVVTGQVLYEEYFTGGAMQLDWSPWFTDSIGLGDSMGVISDTSTPGGDDWAGRISNEYMGMAGLTYAGDAALADYAVEAWIYTMVTAAMGPYNGIAIRMDPVSRYYYRLVSDFDNNARLRLGLVGAGGYPVVIRDWSSGEIPGGVPSTSSWHKFGLTMIADSLWAYYDDQLLPGSPFISDSVTHGHFGVYTFSMTDTASTRCDNIIALDVTGIAEGFSEEYERTQIFPNPFCQQATILLPSYTSTLSIYDIAGRQVKTFSPIENDTRRVQWDGTDESGTEVVDGVYFVVLKKDQKPLKLVKLR